MNALDTTFKGDILIVDDTPDNLRLLSSTLAEHGYKVRSVINGAMALMGAQAAPPDLIMLDIKMPDMDGYEVCQRLKANPQTREIPVIFISALDEVLDKVKAFTSGGVDYIQKPFHIQEVLARIENQLTIRRLQVQLQTQNQQLQQTQANLLQSLNQERVLKQRIEEMATIEERNRIARDIHDSLGHSLVALNIQMEAALTLWQENPDTAYTFLVEAKQLGSQSLEAVRQSVTQIRADPLQGQTLAQAIAKLIGEFHRHTGILPKCQIELSQTLPDALTVAVYRIVQEGLTNICKYAAATAIKIQVQITPNELLLLLEDNGNGFCVGDNAGFGLQGMKERTAALGGQLEINSNPGDGCKITARFPRSTL